MVSLIFQPRQIGRVYVNLVEGTWYVHSHCHLGVHCHLEIPMVPWLMPVRWMGLIGVKPGLINPVNTAVQLGGYHLSINWEGWHSIYTSICVYNNIYIYTYMYSILMEEYGISLKLASFWRGRLYAWSSSRNSPYKKTAHLSDHQGVTLAQKFYGTLGSRPRRAQKRGRGSVPGDGTRKPWSFGTRKP